MISLIWLKSWAVRSWPDWLSWTDRLWTSWMRWDILSGVFELSWRRLLWSVLIFYKLLSLSAVMNNSFICFFYSVIFDSITMKTFSYCCIIWLLLSSSIVRFSHCCMSLMAYSLEMVSLFYLITGLGDLPLTFTGDLLLTATGDLLLTSTARISWFISSCSSLVSPSEFSTCDGIDWL